MIIIIWQKVALHFLKEYFLKSSSIYIFVKNQINPLHVFRPHPSPEDHDLKNLESTLSENTSKQVFGLLPNDEDF